jgi:hypothetical protein
VAVIPPILVLCMWIPRLFDLFVTDVEEPVVVCTHSHRSPPVIDALVGKANVRCLASCAWHLDIGESVLSARLAQWWKIHEAKGF